MQLPKRIRDGRGRFIIVSQLFSGDPLVASSHFEDSFVGVKRHGDDGASSSRTGPSRMTHARTRTTPQEFLAVLFLVPILNTAKDETISWRATFVVAEEHNADLFRHDAKGKQILRPI